MSGSNSGTLLGCLQGLLSNNFSISETPLGLDEKAPVGWNSTLYLENDYPFSGGTAHSRDLARRIAVAEAYERALVDRLCESAERRSEFLLNEIPSCSGFAAGFSQTKTEMRALCEAVERWAWSKWIDDGYALKEIAGVRVPSALANFLRASFVETRFFQQDLLVNTGWRILELKILIFLGFTENGVFPGSRVCLPSECCWDHPVIEASRNFVNFGGGSPLFERRFIASDIIAKRAMFFSANRDVATLQVSRAVRSEWPKASLRLFREFKTDIPAVFLWRAICDGGVPWHEGPVDRFVY